MGEFWLGQFLFIKRWWLAGFVEVFRQYISIPQLQPSVTKNYPGPGAQGPGNPLSEECPSPFFPLPHPVASHQTSVQAGPGIVHIPSSVFSCNLCTLHSQYHRRRTAASFRLVHHNVSVPRRRGPPARISAAGGVSWLGYCTCSLAASATGPGYRGEQGWDC